MKRLRAALLLVLAAVALALIGFPERGKGEARPGKRAESLLTGSVWESGEACRRVLADGTAPRAANVARIGAWNLHWFPDGKPGEQEPSEANDLDWLSCTIAWLGVDVLAMSEIKHGARATAALDGLRARLDVLTGGRWTALIDDCPRSSSQHVGLLYDERRAKLEKSATLGMLNPHGAPCKDQLRPGLAGRFRFPGGLDLTVVATHLKSGSERRSLELRERSFREFGPAAAAARALGEGDGDVLLIGDMNSMGCERCSPAVSPSAELAAIDRSLAAASPKLRRLGAAPRCSHHYRGRATLLDWAAASDLSELPEGRELVVSGYCEQLACSGREPPRALRRLSDHCPVTIDVPDLDRDDEAR